MHRTIHNWWVMAKHHSREYHFKTDSKNYTVAEFYERYKDQFPQLVQVTHGFNGNEFCNVTLKRNQLILVNVNSKIARALTRVKFNGGRKLVSIPDSFHENLCVVQDGESGPEQTLHDILKHKKPPLRIQFPIDRTTKSGIPTEYFPVFDVFDAFNEIHLLANIVSTDLQNQMPATKGYRCKIISDVIYIPLYLPQLCVSVVSGILKQPQELWNEILEELNRQSLEYDYDLLFGKADVAEYSTVDLSRRKNFSTVQPDAFIGVDSFLVAVANENNASKKTDTDEIEDNGYEVPCMPLAVTHQRKEAEANTTEDYENIDEPGWEYEEVLEIPKSCKKEVSVINAEADLKYEPMASPPLPDRPVKNAKVKFVKSLTVSFEGKKTVTMNEAVTHSLRFEEERSFVNLLSQNRRDSSDTYINNIPRTSVKPSTDRQLIPKNKQVIEIDKNVKQGTSKDHSLVKPSLFRPISRESSGQQSQDSVKDKTNITKSETQRSNVPAKPMVWVSSLTIKEVGKHLRKLNLGKYVDEFRAQRVDGEILVEMDKQMLREDFGLSGIETLRLLKFAQEGHVPV